MSNVPKNKRNLSDLEFYHTATILRRDVTALLLRDFGIKDKVRNVDILSKMYNIEPDDKEQLNTILTKYNMQNNILDEYPEWFINYLRERILRCLNDLMMNIVTANDIYSHYESDYYDRRCYQNHAIADCRQLIELLQYAADSLPVDVNKYMPYVELAKKEEALLKGWRKRENNRLKQIRKKQDVKYAIADTLAQIRDFLMGDFAPDFDDAPDNIS